MARLVDSTSDMTDAAKKHDTAYADFAARMLAALAAEEAEIARLNQRMTLHVAANANTTAETVRPVR